MKGLYGVIVRWDMHQTKCLSLRLERNQVSRILFLCVGCRHTAKVYHFHIIVKYKLESTTIDKMMQPTNILDINSVI